jgi:UDP-galactose transporter B1
MARTKQPPVKRESSSEFFNKRTATWEDTGARNGDDKNVPNGQNGSAIDDDVAKASRAVAAEVGEKKDAGLVQLIIAVAGIYASLYVNYTAGFPEASPIVESHGHFES